MGSDAKTLAFFNQSFYSALRRVREMITYIRSMDSILIRAIFGDSYGATLFGAFLLLYLLTWRTGFFLNDSYTVANAFVAVSEGHLTVERAVYGGTLETPGMFVVDGNVYGRNYGQIFLALPFLWVIEGAAAIADLRVAIAAAWGLLVMTVAFLAGDLVECEASTHVKVEEILRYSGSILALIGFVLIIYNATPIDQTQHHLLALQLQTMVAAAFIGVILYRLFTRLHTRRMGLAAGVGIALSAPVGFWASFPKRHILVALTAMVSIYFLYRSREARTQDRFVHRALVSIAGHKISINEAIAFRALAYVPVGILAWVNAFEGVLLLLVLFIVDISTGNRNIPSIAAAAIALVLSSMPMFITNYLISGNPLQPPHALLLSRFDGQGLGTQTGDSGSSGGTGGGGAASPGPNDSAGSESYISEALDITTHGVLVVVDTVKEGILLLTTDLDWLYPLLIRSNYHHSIAYHESGEIIRLSVLESLPLTAALIALPALLWKANVRSQVRTIFDKRQLSPARTVDAFVLVYAVLVALVFIQRLDTGSQVTGRYVLAMYPPLLYGVARLPAVRRVVTEHIRTGTAAYVSGVCIGGQLLFIWLYLADTSLGEASQIHSLVSIITAVLVAGWIILDTSGIRRDRVGAVVLGLAAASGTVFFLLVKLWHFRSLGSLALPFF